MIKKLIQKIYYENSQIIKIWIIYILVIHSLPFIFSIFGLSKELPFNFKTYLIDFWGYYWDGAHYLKITQSGYSYPLQAFFPGYPLLLKTLDLFLPFTVIYKINVLLTLPMLIQLKALLIKMRFTERQILFGMIGFLSFPTSFFLQANYTETIYILISAWGLNLFLEKKYFKAAISGFFLSFIKITSAVFTLVFFISLIREFKKKLFTDQKNFQYLLITALTLGGIVIYFSFLNFQFKDFMIFFKAQGEWGRATQEIPFISEFQDIKKKFIFQKITEVLVFVFGIFLFIYSYKKIPLELYLFSILHFLIPLATGTFLSINRLFLLSFPVLIWFFANISKNKTIYWIFFLLFLTLQIVGLNLFIRGHFIG